MLVTWMRRVYERIGRKTGIGYWEKRAKRYGARSVLNIGHTGEEMAALTERQKEILFPLLAGQLRGDERVIVDFGCGPGRFTPSLSELVRGSAIGVDPIQRLLDLAPCANGVEYRRVESGRIPVADGSADVIWVCLVLGTITEEDALGAAAAEIRRVLHPDGLLFVVENTARKPDLPHFRFRTVDAYLSLFPWAQLDVVGGYEDLGERISVLAGRRGS
ncbi:hypothetical protein BH23GEM3_BH23GEM3_08030 [soil metagenome]|nr:class I SAM-dependent methyltransferase [Gemmatimonadota bacterium]